MKSSLTVLIPSAVWGAARAQGFYLPEVWALGRLSHYIALAGRLKGFVATTFGTNVVPISFGHDGGAECPFSVTHQSLAPLRRGFSWAASVGGPVIAVAALNEGDPGRLEATRAVKEPRERLQVLLRQPLCGRVPRHRVPEQLSRPWPRTRKANRRSKVSVGTMQRSIATMASDGCAGMSAKSAMEALGAGSCTWRPSTRRSRTQA
jgi:hypothetical protein